MISGDLEAKYGPLGIDQNRTELATDFVTPVGDEAEPLDPAVPDRAGCGGQVATVDNTVRVNGLAIWEFHNSRAYTHFLCWARLLVERVLRGQEKVNVDHQRPCLHLARQHKRTRQVDRGELPQLAPVRWAA